MNSRLTVRRLRAVAILAIAAAGLLVGCNASSRADERADALDKAIPAAMQRASVPGAIVGIWQDGREPYVRAFGVRDTATRQPMATDLSMRIGSNSKTFTVTSILMLAEQGKFGLDEAITAMDALADSTVRQRLTDLGQEIPSPEQQTAEALAAHQKAEIEK